MNSMLNNGQYVSTKTNRNTGRPERQWIEYADGVFEPVRRNGNLNKKHHGNKRTLDWWTVDKPLEWSPANEGKQVSLNHDYGQKAKFKAAAKATPDKGTGGDQPGKATPDKPGAPGKSTISQGAAGLWEHAARDKAEAEKSKTSTQAARKLDQWERGQGIDPNQRSGHERRPPSSSRDAAELEHRRHQIEQTEFPAWLTRARERGLKKDPIKGWISFNEDLAAEGASQVVKDGLKNAKTPLGKIVGKSVPGLGIIWDYIIAPDEVSD